MDKITTIENAVEAATWLRIQTKTKCIIARPLQCGYLAASLFAADFVVEYRNGSKIERIFAHEIVHLEPHEFTQGEEMKQTLNRLAGSYTSGFLRWK